MAVGHADVLSIDESDIRRNGPGSLLQVCWRQWQTERKLRTRGINFRTADPNRARAAFSAMSCQEFEAINARQNWANWRTIPRSLSGLVPNRPLQVVDLGCGTGGSTSVLACYAPLGSQIIGYDMAEGLLEIAHSRVYLHECGQPVEVGFRCQSISEALSTSAGHLVPEGSIDLVNSSGVMGHHLRPEAVRRLAVEIARVSAPGGIALLDVSHKLRPAELVSVMRRHGFSPLRHRRSSPFDLTGQLAFRAQQ